MNQKLNKLLFCLLVTGFWLLSTSCFASPVSSKELIDNAKSYDGKTVTYKGEAIGDIMARKSFAWVNINDGMNAIGIWVDKSKTRDIFYTGTHRSKGDIIEIEGIFHRACLEHGGDLDIHADTLYKIENGRATEEKPDIFKKEIALILFIILCVTVILSKIIRLRKSL